MSKYHYSPLEADDVRLLELYAGEFEAELEGRLLTFRLSEDSEPTHDHSVLLTRVGGSTVDNAPSYQALSYSWGSDAKAKQSIRIHKGEKFYRVSIKPNLHGALRRLRKEIPMDQAQFYWTYALCINQEDNSEKSAQVQNVAIIYNRAESVAVWLGEEDKDSGRAVEFIDKLLKLENFDPLTEDPGTTTEWAALMNLMQRPWFNRRWIVQEIALARRATMYCGNDAISWRDFSCAVSLFVSRHHDLRPLFQSSREYAHHPDFLGEVDALGAKALVDITNTLFRKTDEGIILERLLSLEALVSALIAFDVTDPRDTIYAVLWLAHDAEPGSYQFAAMSHDALIRTPLLSPEYATVHSPDDEASFCRLEVDTTNVQVEASSPNASVSLRTERIPTGLAESSRPSSNHLRLPETYSNPARVRSVSDISIKSAEERFKANPVPIIVDYSKEVYDVYKEFLEFAIGRSNSLDIICFPWAPEPLQDSPELPSWICQLSGTPFEKKPCQNSYGRVRADPLVGSPGNGARKYNASGKTKIYPNQNFIKQRTLIVTGFVLDAVGVIKSAAYGGTIPSTWLDLVGWSGPPDPVPDRFWRTLVADRGLGDQKMPPAHWPLTCQWVFGQRSKRGALSTNDILTAGVCPSVSREFLRRVQTVTWGRSLSLSEGRRNSSQLLALVPEEAQTGDLICILYGCSVPVLLRKTKKRKDPESPSFGAVRGKRNVPTVSVNDKVDPAKSPAVGTIMDHGVADHRQKQSTNPLPSLTIPPAKVDLHASSMGVRRARRKESHTKKAPPLPVSTDRQHQYSFVGECYVHGMMAGEGFKHQLKHGNGLEVFHIV